MTTTLDRVRSMSKEFASLTDVQLNMLIEDATLEVSSLTIPDDQRERLTRYLAAHLASMDVRKVVKEKVDVIERTYSDSGSGGTALESTSFGLEYQRILNSLSGTDRKKLNLTVL
ncbi:DUF4054 domain-containing protein [Mesobacillus zeae]|uniref:DUF4054 domain-containing protein n=1 Tax=Mesobacillus zeae TaxID=1917180 RepID=A0A398BBH2_9BACI|nr:DUF4054 domain-containing protein [Mesobacillus zeae]RID85026.1 DUF4054 domain-containing protein [Mesobacillus zeae]